MKAVSPGILRFPASGPVARRTDSNCASRSIGSLTLAARIRVPSRLRSPTQPRCTLELYEGQYPGETVMATPAISGGVLYIRGGKHLFAIGVRP
jgi:hypothetical protein